MAIWELLEEIRQMAGEQDDGFLESWLWEIESYVRDTDAWRELGYASRAAHVEDMRQRLNMSRRRARGTLMYREAYQRLADLLELLQPYESNTSD